MNYEEIINVLDGLNYLDDRGYIRSRFIKSIRDTNVEQIITKATEFLPTDTKLSYRIHAIRQDVYSHPNCYCGKPVMFHPTKASTTLFADCCSRECASTNPNKFKKLRSTNLDRYGAETYLQSEVGKVKRQNTNLEKYGHISPAANVDVREKIKATNLEKYGHENVLCSDYGKQKIRNYKNKVRKIQQQKYEGDIDPSLNGDGTRNTYRVRHHSLDYLSNPNWLQDQLLQRSVEDIALELESSVDIILKIASRFGINVHE